MNAGTGQYPADDGAGCFGRETASPVGPGQRVAELDAVALQPETDGPATRPDPRSTITQLHSRCCSTAAIA
jgi:hypothetical protein